MRDALVQIMARIEDIDADLWEEGQEVGHPFWEALDDIHGIAVKALNHGSEGAAGLARTVRKMVEDGHPDDPDWFRIITEALKQYDGREEAQ